MGERVVGERVRRPSRDVGGNGRVGRGCARGIVKDLEVRQQAEQ